MGSQTRSVALGGYPPACGARPEGEGEVNASVEGDWTMKPLIGLVALLFATSAFAQAPPPKGATKPHAQVRPQAPMGCKLVGAVRGTKIWAGDCIAAAPAVPAAETPQPAPPPGAPAPAEKQ